MLELSLRRNEFLGFLLIVKVEALTHSVLTLFCLFKVSLGFIERLLLLIDDLEDQFLLCLVLGG